MEHLTILQFTRDLFASLTSLFSTNTAISETTLTGSTLSCFVNLEYLYFVIPHNLANLSHAGTHREPMLCIYLWSTVTASIITEVLERTRFVQTHVISLHSWIFRDVSPWP